MASEPKSKTLAVALKELREKLDESDKVTISDLAEQLAVDLPLKCNIYLPYGKKLSTLSFQRQLNRLYTVTYALISA